MDSPNGSSSPLRKRSRAEYEDVKAESEVVTTPVGVEGFLSCPISLMLAKMMIRIFRR